MCDIAGGYLKEFTDEESNFAALLQRAMDLEGVDRETVHQLVALLMKVCLSYASLKLWLFLIWRTVFDSLPYS